VDPVTLHPFVRKGWLATAGCAGGLINVNTDPPGDVHAAAAFVRSSATIVPGIGATVGIVLGSGLGATADRVLASNGSSIDYVDIRGMPNSRVVGHRGRLVVGAIGSANVIILQGRVHSYEGCDVDEVTFGVRLLRTLGVSTIILTNAAGGIRAGIRSGDVMVITGHIAFPQSVACVTTGRIGDQNRTLAGHVKPSLVWDPVLIHTARTTETPLTVHQGTYAMMSGPNYETPAEIRMLRWFGADAVGMSTVPEANRASAAGMRVLGVSCITNVAAGLGDARLDHAEVSRTAHSIESEFSNWLFRIIENLPR
jgi:purine-nucleoside phosphorylase